MSRYSQEELKAMAKSCQWYKVNNPEDYLGFLLTMSMHSGLHPNAVEHMINQIAEGKE